MNQATNLQEDTIFALSTCYGKSGIAIIRISGPQAVTCARDFHVQKTLLPRVATLTYIRDHITGEFIDEILVMHFPKNYSYTGQDLIEFQLHGSIAIINKVISQLQLLPYLRLAQNGEFTKLALINDRISVLKAESLVDVMNAETEFQRKAVAQSFSGENEEVFTDLKTHVIRVLASAEAFIDFPEDTHDYNNELNKMIHLLVDDFQKINKKIEGANTLMNGINITIVGKVNVGKSTLMNLLTEDDTSIVSGLMGTTRDIIKCKSEISGVPVMFHDTAGIRQSSDQIEKIGMAKALSKIGESHIIILVLDINSEVDPASFEWIYETLPLKSKLLILLNKVDLYHTSLDIKAREKYLLRDLGTRHDIIHSLTFTSKTELLKVREFLTKFVHAFVSPTNNYIVLNTRKQEMLQNCLDLLFSALKQKTLELKAAELSYITDQLGCLLGKIENNEMLDELFSSFCIGK